MQEPLVNERPTVIQLTSRTVSCKGFILTKKSPKAQQPEANDS